MVLRLSARHLLACGAMFVAAGHAQAALTVSQGATAHVTCQAGSCRATAPEAVLNAAELQAMLASGPVALSATSGSRDLVIAARLCWAASTILSLKAPGPVVIGAPVLAGGGVSIASGAKSGPGLTFAPRGMLSFAQGKNGSLVINGTPFQLVTSVAELAQAASAQPVPAIALATSYDARPDGAYAASPVSQPFMGVFDGLGHTIAHLSVSASQAGLFANIFYGAAVRNLTLSGATMAGGDDATAGILAASSNGDVTRVRALGTVTVGQGGVAGGLIGALNSATVSKCSAAVHVSAGDGATAGGLVGQAATGSVQQSFAIASVRAGVNAYAAGLVGNMARSAVLDSYARGAVSAGDGGYAGGITAYLGGSATHRSYSIAQLSGGAATMGGLVGANSSAPPPNSSIIDAAYWDLTSSGQQNGVGAGPGGGTGLTTPQLRQGLPSGFDDHVWAETAGVNDGLPYLRAFPPL